MKHIKQFENFDKVNEEIGGGSHASYNPSEARKIKRALRKDKLILTYIPPMYIGHKHRIALSDDEYILMNKKSDLLKQYDISTVTTGYDDPDTKYVNNLSKPYKLIDGELEELPKEEGWTTNA